MHMGGRSLEHYVMTLFKGLFHHMFAKTNQKLECFSLEVQNLPLSNLLGTSQLV